MATSTLILPSHGTSLSFNNKQPMLLKYILDLMFYDEEASPSDVG
jgi:hypothetical protein